MSFGDYALSKDHVYYRCQDMIFGVDRTDYSYHNDLIGVSSLNLPHRGCVLDPYLSSYFNCLGKKKSHFHETKSVIVI